MTSSPLDLTLYVAGRSPRAERALQNLQRLLDHRGIPFEVEVVDVLDRPDLAEKALILATPTLLRNNPLPPRRLIGDLSDTAVVLHSLQLDPEAGELP
ncbi:circadian clock KaiB family protein [Euzebya tangerina]|uniref:circadian clock KaiB family protein n=1 Tax=Euzebya tangerina TaxID=591198 RepID=UPI00196A4D6E|nr:circadian clock KaiB family protein [Euzebya tangerina]